MKVKRIKIIKGSSWYSDKVGLEFNVLEDDMYYYLPDTMPSMNICKEHVEIVTELDYTRVPPYGEKIYLKPPVKFSDKDTAEKIKNKLPHLHKVLTDKYNLAVDKNADYGNSFDKIMDKLIDHNIDPLQGLYIRLADKFNRFETLLFSDVQKVKDESIRDTLRDLSNYVDLYMAWEAKNNGE